MWDSWQGKQVRKTDNSFPTKSATASHTCKVTPVHLLDLHLPYNQAWESSWWGLVTFSVRNILLTPTMRFFKPAYNFGFLGPSSIIRTRAQGRCDPLQRPTSRRWTTLLPSFLPFLLTVDRLSSLHAPFRGGPRRRRLRRRKGIKANSRAGGQHQSADRGERERERERSISSAN